MSTATLSPPVYTDKEKARAASKRRWDKQQKAVKALEATESDYLNTLKDIKSQDESLLKQSSKRDMLEATVIVGKKYLRDLCAGVKKTHQEAMTWGLFYDKIHREDEPLRAQSLVINLFGAGSVSEKLVKSTLGIEAKSITYTTHSEKEPVKIISETSEVIEKQEEAP